MDLDKSSSSLLQNGVWTRRDMELNHVWMRENHLEAVSSILGFIEENPTSKYHITVSSDRPGYTMFVACLHGTYHDKETKPIA